MLKVVSQLSNSTGNPFLTANDFDSNSFSVDQSGVITYSNKSVQTTLLSSSSATVSITNADGSVYMVDSPATLTYNITATSGSFYLLLIEPTSTQTFTDVTFTDTYTPLFNHTRTYLIYFVYDGTKWVADVIAEKITGTFDHTVDADNSLLSILEDAESGDVIGFADEMAGETIALSADLSISANVIIDASTLSSKPVIAASTYIISCAGDIEFRGIEFTGSAPSSGTTHTTITNTSGHLHIIDCYFNAVTARKAVINSDAYCYVKDSVFLSCIVKASASGVCYFAGTEFKVIGSEFTTCFVQQMMLRCGGTGVISRTKISGCYTKSQASSSDPAYSALVRVSGTATIVNCFVTGAYSTRTNLTYCYPICTYSSSGSPLLNIINTTLAGNNGGVANQTGTINLYNSIVADNDETNIYGNVNNAGAKSILVTGSLYNFHPTNNAINSGDLSYIDTYVYNRDLDGYKRATDTIDLGCYEHTKIAINNIPNNTDVTEIFPAQKITADQIEDGTITTAKTADNFVTTAKIADNAVTTEKMPSGSFTTAVSSSNITPPLNRNVIRLSPSVQQSYNFLDNGITAILNNYDSDTDIIIEFDVLLVPSGIMAQVTFTHNETGDSSETKSSITVNNDEDNGTYNSGALIHFYNYAKGSSRVWGAYRIG